MHIDIQTNGFELTEALSAFTKKQVRKALKTRVDHILSAQIGLSDINGPRGGIDKCCRLRVQIPGTSSIVISDTSEDMYTAISRATSRASTSVGRRLARLRGQKRGQQIQSPLPFNKYSFSI